MLKILYAANNNESSKIALDRFIEAVKDKSYQIKIAAYRISSPRNLNIDWTLDCLLNIHKQFAISAKNNDNYEIYYQQVKKYNPDVIITDLEYFTSYIANRLSIKLWQCSSSLINYGLSHDEKYDLGFFKTYSFLSNRFPMDTQRIINIIDNSDCLFVCSHFGDLDSPPKLKPNFQWVRPYHQVGKSSVPCQHNIVAHCSFNKNIFNILKRYDDCVIFGDFNGEIHDNIRLKARNNLKEYYCNLKNCNLFICEGQGNFLADAYYNGKYSIIVPKFDDIECLLNSSISEK